jgi:tRNA threonylcarbamoyladenosine biosynthesis protein TsaE
MAPTLTYQRELSLADEAATMGLGERLARNLAAPQVIFLHGELGAGKTTFSRGFLRGRGHAGSVKSPTYTLVEPYEEMAGGPVYHLDLYRLGDAQELAFLGMEDYLSAGGYLLIEWPERAPNQLPSPTITLSLSASGTGRLATVCAAAVDVFDGLAC